MEPATAAIIASTLLSSAGSVYNNRQQIKYQQDANSDSIALANTQHQREVRDLEAAGLNPILSANGSGAAVPTLGIPSTENPLSDIAQGVSSAARLSRLDVPRVESQIAMNASSAQEMQARSEQQKLENEFLRKTMDDRVAREKWLAEHPGFISSSESEGYSINGTGSNSAKSVREPVVNPYHPEVKRRALQQEMDYQKRVYDYEMLPMWRKIFTPKPKRN